MNRLETFRIPIKYYKILEQYVINHICSKLTELREGLSHLSRRLHHRRHGNRQIPVKNKNKL